MVNPTKSINFALAIGRRTNPTEKSVSAMTNSEFRFINNGKCQIKAWKTILSTLPAILKVAEKYDGKVINKRFFDKIKEVISTEIGYVDKARYTSDHRIEVYLNQSYRWDSASNTYIDENSFAIYPVPQSTQEYIDLNKRFNLALFKEAVAHTTGLLNERIDELQKSIDGLEHYQAVIKELENHVKETLATIPYPIRPRMSFEKKV